MRLRHIACLVAGSFFALSLMLPLGCRAEDPLTIDEYSALMCETTNTMFTNIDPSLTWGEYSAAASILLDTLRDTKPPEELREVQSAMISLYESIVAYADIFDAETTIFEPQDMRDSGPEYERFAASREELVDAFDALPAEINARIDEFDCTPPNETPQ